MTTASTRFDAWTQGQSYDTYMGRWSREIAPRFLDWLDPAPGLDWLELGCGTGALTGVIAAQARPRSLVALDRSEPFVARARRTLAEDRVDLRVGDAAAPGLGPASRDVVASGLLLNFLPDRPAALSAWREILRPGGTLAFYVWDYPDGGLEFLRAFWTAAVAIDPAAQALTEGQRFPFCTRRDLSALVSGAGFRDVVSLGIEVPTVFASFEDFWEPFLGGAGPAPGYCDSLPSEARARLRNRLASDLGAGVGGPIRLKARAWAFRASA
ncbi:class I SAM-dependent methyltransferase [Rubellimicrobium arenae]|uniref:class I SAM-dependent methyltransferase n=1 Tax=Rubellimicrobium arenae TaxID=2817372 RepID=UPI001B304F91|nr:class I SAM-dependent methyltransferase [Rubellimicrobium arenae]